MSAFSCTGVLHCVRFSFVVSVPPNCLFFMGLYTLTAVGCRDTRFLVDPDLQADVWLDDTAPLTSDARSFLGVTNSCIFLQQVKSELLLNTQAASATQRADIENHLSTVKRSLDDKVKELQKVTEDASAAKSSLEGLKVRPKADLCFSFAVFLKKCSTVWTTCPVS